MTPVGIIVRLIDFYQILIIVYVVMSWIRPRGLLFDIYRTLGTIVEPWIGIFRRIIPSMGMIDISPIVAMIALSLIASALVRFLR
jgi:uncharacterized protein YggT (Ycf19 family)